MLVVANKRMYVTLPKRQKILLSRSIVNAVRSQAPPGRFLQEDPKSHTWYDVGDQRAQEKTSQALREGAAVVREEVLVQAYQQANGESSSATGVVTPPPQLPPPVPAQMPNSNIRLDNSTAVPEDANGKSNIATKSTSSDDSKNKEEERDVVPEMVGGGKLEEQFMSIGSFSLGGSVAPPGVEPGFSFGSVSMGPPEQAGQGMSFGSVPMTTENLPTLSIGSAMSFTRTPETVDGGLEPFVTSIGSLSMTSMDQQQLREALLSRPPPADSAATYETPTILGVQRSTDNLLECSDTESETEEDSSSIQRGRSADWEKMKSTLHQHAGINPISSSAGATDMSVASGFGDPQELERNVTSTTVDMTQLDYVFSEFTVDDSTKSQEDNNSNTGDGKSQSLAR